MLERNLDEKRISFSDKFEFCVTRRPSLLRTTIINLNKLQKEVKIVAFNTSYQLV